MTGYPVILNGDHAEFELEHANTPPKERPDWPLPSFDAKDWAEAFCKLNPSMDEGLMLAWFAAALMRGYDERAALQTENDGLRDTLRGLKWSVCESEVLRDPAVKGRAREILNEIASLTEKTSH